MHSFFFFFNDTATTAIYTLSLHDALPIFAFRTLDDTVRQEPFGVQNVAIVLAADREIANAGHIEDFFSIGGDRKSTRLNSSHVEISYAVFCLKKKKTKKLRE